MKEDYIRSFIFIVHLKSTNMKSANASFFKLMLAAVLISSCKKELNTPTTSTAEILAISNHANVESKCRLVFLDWPTSSTWQFHYNEKGLADQWIIDYGFGSPLHTNEMTYDDENRMIQSKEVYFGFNYVIDFFYENNRISRLRRSSVEFSAILQDFTFTYNSKGEIIRQDDNNNDIHVLMFYDAMGNCTKTDLYFGDFVAYSDNYTFEQSARNPALNIPGVTIGFPFYGGTLIANKRWFTTNRTVIAPNDVFNDFDPSKTEIDEGNHHFPLVANYFDRISNGPINITFDYENCNGSTKSGSPLLQAQSSPQAFKTGLQSTPLLIRNPAQLLNEKIQKMRQN